MTAEGVSLFHLRIFESLSVVFFVVFFVSSFSILLGGEKA